MASSSPSLRRARATSPAPRTPCPKRSRRRSTTGRLRASPTVPRRWLLTVARRKQIDAARRRRRRAASAVDHLRLVAEELDAAAAGNADIPDSRLQLMFACAHPAIEAGVRAPLDAADDPRLRRGDDRLGLPGRARDDGPAAGARQDQDQSWPAFHFACRSAANSASASRPCSTPSTRVFSEGWSDPAGIEARRRNLAEEGIWLGRLVVSLMPDEPEALGLLALMLLRGSAARRAPQCRRRIRSARRAGSGCSGIGN